MMLQSQLLKYSCLRSLIQESKITRQVLLGGTTRARPGMLLLIPNHVWMFASLLHAEMNMIAAWLCGEGAE